MAKETTIFLHSNLYKMTKNQLQEALNIQLQIEQKEKQIQAFERGKIKSITLRQFDETDCTQTDIEMTSGIPRSRLKQIMIDVLKEDLRSLQYRFDNFLIVQEDLELSIK